MIASVFVCGAVVMIFELVGSRIMAPSYGTSLYVWTGIIGVIMGSLALGYWLGGKMADRRADVDTYAAVIFASGLAIFWAFVFKDIIPAAFDARRLTLGFASLASAVWLFAPASVLLGIVTPYAVRLKISSLETSASTVGNLYAASTFGSIVGTFSAGYWLIPFLGISAILMVLVLILLALSFVFSRKLIAIRVFVTVALVASFFMIFFGNSIADRRAGLTSLETAYNSVRIFTGIDAASGKTARFLSFDSFARQGAMFLDSDELVCDYTKFYRLADHFNPRASKTLMIGGGAYSYPKDFLARHHDAEMTVVEIDPGVTAAAKTFFRLPEDRRLRIVSADARTFLNSASEKFDVIFDDAFNSAVSTPFQLTTVEAVRRQYELLNDGGAVVANVLSSATGARARFLLSETATFAAVFPQVYLFRVSDEVEPDALQNIILVALKSKEKASMHNADPELDDLLQNLWTPPQTAAPILTDDHAPVEYYMKGVL